MSLNSQPCFTVIQANETYDENKRKEGEKWNEYKLTVQAYKKRCIVTGRDNGRAAISNFLPGTTTSLEQIVFWMCGTEGIQRFKTKTMQQHVQICQWKTHQNNSSNLLQKFTRKEHTHFLIPKSNPIYIILRESFKVHQICHKSYSIHPFTQLEGVHFLHAFALRSKKQSPMPEIRSI